MSNEPVRFLQPSSSALATALAAAYNLIQPHKSAGPVINPTGASAESAKKFAELVGDCAKIMHDKVAGGGT